MLGKECAGVNFSNSVEIKCSYLTIYRNSSWFQISRFQVMYGDDQGLVSNHPTEIQKLPN